MLRSRDGAGAEASFEVCMTCKGDVLVSIAGPCRGAGTHRDRGDFQAETLGVASTFSLPPSLLPLIDSTNS